MEVKGFNAGREGLHPLSGGMEVNGFTAGREGLHPLSDGMKVKGFTAGREGLHPLSGGMEVNGFPAWPARRLYGEGAGRGGEGDRGQHSAKPHCLLID